jgi:hypothetical protein
MLTVAQQFVNLAERLITNVFTLTINVNGTVYDMLQNGPADYCGNILSVTDNNNNEITFCNPGALGQNSRSWWVDRGTKILSWSMVGKTLLVVVPSVTASTITARYTTLTPTITSASNMTVPDDTTEHVARLTELICRIKTRQFTDFEAKVKSLEADMRLVDAMSDTGGKAD